MHRLLIIASLFVFAIMPAVAQDDTEFEPIFEATEVFTVQDLGFEFFYPAGWVFDTSDGINLAETESDLEALISDDPTVTAEGYTMSLTAFPVEAFGLEDPTLDELVEEFVTLAEVTVDETVEVPVMARRSISIIGRTEASGRGGILTMWREDGFVVLFSFGVPDSTADGNEGFTWGQIIGSMTPIAEVEADELLELPDFGVALSYPSEWSVVSDDEGARIYELESDADNDAVGGTPEGVAIAMVFGTTDEIGFDPTAPTPEIADFIISAFGFENPETLTVEEFVVLGDVRGVGVSGEDTDSRGFQVILFGDDETGRVLLYALSVPTFEDLTAVENTSLQVLQSMFFLEE